MTHGEIQSILNTTHTHLINGIMIQPLDKQDVIQMTGMIHTHHSLIKCMDNNKVHNKEDQVEDNHTPCTPHTLKITCITKTMSNLPTTRELTTTGDGENKKIDSQR